MQPPKWVHTHCLATTEAAETMSAVAAAAVRLGAAERAWSALEWRAARCHSPRDEPTVPAPCWPAAS